MPPNDASAMLQVYLVRGVDETVLGIFNAVVQIISFTILLETALIAFETARQRGTLDNVSRGDSVYVWSEGAWKLSVTTR